jgi:hypothetical protein
MLMCDSTSADDFTAKSDHRPPTNLIRNHPRIAKGDRDRRLH